MENLIYSTLGIAILISAVLLLTFFEDLQRVWSYAVSEMKNGFGLTYRYVHNRFVLMRILPSGHLWVNPADGAAAHAASKHGPKLSDQMKKQITLSKRTKTGTQHRP